MPTRKISDIDFVVFDVETTGLDPKSGDRIIEIAAIRHKNGQSRESFSSLINPQREISPAAFAVNHITQDMVDGAPYASQVIPEFLEFIGSSCLAGYNVGFDLRFLENELGLFDRRLPQRTEVIDVMSMARRILPSIASYGLASVANFLRISMPQEHRALSDCLLTAEAFDKLLALLKTKGIDNYLQFYNLFCLNPAITENINNQNLASIQRAIDLGVSLKLKYYSSSSREITEREVKPKEVLQKGRDKYLIGWCSLRKDERTFKINAILNLEII